MNCIICNRPPTEEQPTYCLFCYVFIPQLVDGKFKGTARAKCPSCNHSMGTSRPEKCGQCSLEFNIEHQAISDLDDTDELKREHNRQMLAKQILGDKTMHEQIINILGLDRMSRIEQGVALTSLSKEKIHCFSGDYNFTEAHTLVDMGYGICKEIGEKWASDIAQIRLAGYHLRSGRTMLAKSLLSEVIVDFPKDTTVNKLRYLEIKSLLALANRLTGFKEIADILVKETYSELEVIFNEMQEDIQAYITSGEKKSQFLGMAEDGGSFPRVDMVGTVLITLIEEGIVMGKDSNAKISNEVLNRLLEFDNIMELLTKMTPSDDTGFFASYLRDYMRFFEALFWYDDFLLQSDNIKKQVLIERFFIIINEWLAMIPTQFWLPLRPARIIEIFLRAGKWHDNIDGEKIPQFFLSNSSEYHLPSFYYAIADAYAKVGNYDKSIVLLDKMMKVETLEESLREMGEKLKWTIQLEINGILMGVDMPESRLNLPISIQLNQLRHHLEPETYMNEMLDETLPILRLSFEPSKIIENNIALFGDRLLEVQKKIHEQLISVGDYSYNHLFWDYGQQLKSWGILDPSEYNVTGSRMEVVIIQSVIRESPVYFLFEGQQQSLTLRGKEITIKPSPLLILRGVIQHINMELFELMELLVMVMQGDTDIIADTTIYVMKKQD